MIIDRYCAILAIKRGGYAPQKGETSMDKKEQNRQAAFWYIAYIAVIFAGQSIALWFLFDTTYYLLGLMAVFVVMTLINYHYLSGGPDKSAGPPSLHAFWPLCGAVRAAGAGPGRQPAGADGRRLRRYSRPAPAPAGPCGRLFCCLPPAEPQLKNGCSHPATPRSVPPILQIFSKFLSCSTKI